MIDTNDRVSQCTYVKRCEHVDIVLGLDNQPYVFCNHPDGQNEISKLDKCPKEETPKWLALLGKKERL